ncbi:hypothetical protein GQ53DRAFT_760310 [Thozetella sp. PMI_491]|nr:hypothetical protein GQ53DRAFT_760310 [Thozetella sp. PMI_491]
MRSKKYEIATELAKSGAAVTPSDLFAAAKGGDVDLVTQLVRMGLHPDDAAHNGITVVQVALLRGHGLVAKILISFGASHMIRELYAQRFTVLSVSVLEAALLGLTSSYNDVLE